MPDRAHNLYYDPNTGAQYSLNHIRRQYPHISFCDNWPDLTEYGYSKMTYTDPPAPQDEDHEVIQSGHIDGVIQWKQQPLTPEKIIARDKSNAMAAASEEARLDPMVQTFIGMTQGQVANYIDTNVTDLASAKTFLKLVSKMLLIMAKRQYGG
jgi:hypothetical protein